MTTELALTKEWYTKLEEQASQDFINLPLKFQMEEWNYNEIAKHYLMFFLKDFSRANKLTLAKQFQEFVRNINKNRAKFELGEEFFECFHHFMENFKELTTKWDSVHLQSLRIIADGLDKSRFVEDIISIDELKSRITRLQKTEKQEAIINAEWEDFELEYEVLNNEV